MREGATDYECVSHIEQIRTLRIFISYEVENNSSQKQYSQDLEKNALNRHRESHSGIMYEVEHDDIADKRDRPIRKKF